MSLSGTVSRSDNFAGIEGVTITLTPGGATAVTDSGGVFVFFPDPPTGNYTATPTLAGFEFDPPTEDFFYDGAATGLAFDGLETPAAPVEPYVPPVVPAQQVQLVHLHVAGTTYYFSTGAYSDQGRRFYDARITAWVTWERSVGCRLWSRGSRSGVGAVELANPDGGFDALLQADARGGLIQVYECLDTQPIEQATLVATAEVASVDRVDSRGLRIVTRDPLAVLDVPIQRDLYVDADSVDESLIGTPKPLAFGAPLSCEPVPRSYADQIYDCHDNRDQLIEAGMLVRDNAGSVGFDLAASPYAGVQLDARAIGAVVVDVVTGGGSAAEIIGPALGNFDSSLTGWTVDGDGGSVTWQSPGRVRFLGSAAQRPSLSIGSAIEAGISYSWQVEVVSLEEGALEVRAGGQRVELLDSVKTWSGDFVAGSDGSFEIIRAAGEGGIADTPRPAPIDALIDNVRLSSLVYGATSSEVIQQIWQRSASDPTGLSIQALVQLSVLRPWQIAYYARSPVQAREVLQQALDSVLGWAYALPDGRIAVGVLQPPDTGTVALVIDESIILGEVSVERDEAPGLSVTVAGRRNWRPYSASELIDDPAIDGIRAALQAEYRTKRKVEDPISTELGPRESSELTTLLSDPADIEALAELLAELYPASARPRFFTADVASTAAVRALVPGQRVQIELRETTANARLIGIASSGMRTRITAWGWM
jgi:hypothetical protein